MFLDTLTLSSLLWVVPDALWTLVKRHRRLSVCYFQSSRLGRLLMSGASRLGLVVGEEADYSFADVRDSSGSNPGYQLDSTDTLRMCGEVRAFALENSRVVHRLQRHFDKSRLLLFLEKRLGLEITPMLSQIQVVSWYGSRNGATGTPPVCFIQRTILRRWLEDFASERDVSLRWYGFWWAGMTVSIGGPLRVALTTARRVVRGLVVLANVRRVARSVWKRRRARVAPRGDTNSESAGATIAMPYWGIGLTSDPGRNSELFWVPFSPLAPDRLLIYFNDSQFPLDDETYASLRRRSIRAIAMKDSTRASSQVPIWGTSQLIRSLVPGSVRALKIILGAALASRPWSRIDRWVLGRTLRFIWVYTYWRCFFETFNVKVHVDLTESMPDRIGADQAIADLGGVSASYQRSSEELPSLVWASAVDVRFGFSPAVAEIKRQSRSSIGQFVAVGYTYDQAFASVQPRANRVRAQLQERGARFIVCFFDGISADDKRRFFSHEHRAEDYRFLLEKLLSDPSLGLIFKPKKPVTLRRRLGNVETMLDAALITGRCAIFEEGTTTSSEVLPCEASLASDLAIAILWGPTPGIESALAGTPTMFMDRAYIPYHPLYKLGVGEVVFNDWPSLWERIEDGRRDSAQMPWFGNGSPRLKEFDPFRDGRAAERIGSYIGSVARSLGQGHSASEALARAQQQYTDVWGTNKVVHLR